MNKKKELLAYCGLYCGDCAGYSGEIADAAQNLREITQRYKFDQTAKNLFPKELKDYDKFREMINFMTQLKCPKTCRSINGNEVKCEISKCCREKGFYACHECSTFEICDKLKNMSALHGDSCVKNLKSIKKMGIDSWIREGKRFWFADDE
ncbi:MAG: DUF3795 domain-containing protein [candidate division WOR-3 bacterium]|nr:MAG: DUF3795 domain-containing protein [candidate division WOR-3 bacterium]